MATSQRRPQRKLSGSKYISDRSKRKFELAGFPAETKLGVNKSKIARIRGGGSKRRMLSGDTVTLSGKKGKAVVVKIKAVLENPANPNLVRRNMLTKGTVIDTEKGRAVITSRPGQHGILNAKLL